jgi:hypothetical protein
LYLDVFQNGIKLKAGDDYTATTGTSVVLVQGASVNDVVEMVAFDVFSVNDSVSASAGGGFAGNISSPIVTGSTSFRTPLIEFTDGDDAIAIADGGVVTLLTTAVAKSEGGAVTTNITQGLTKAWFNLNAATPALRDSFNIGSITDEATGRYEGNFTNALSNVNYSVYGSASVTSDNGSFSSFTQVVTTGDPGNTNGLHSTASTRVNIQGAGEGAAHDPQMVHSGINGDLA